MVLSELGARDALHEFKDRADHSGKEALDPYDSHSRHLRLKWKQKSIVRLILGQLLEKANLRAFVGVVSIIVKVSGLVLGPLDKIFS